LPAAGSKSAELLRPLLTSLCDKTVQAVARYAIGDITVVTKEFE